MDETSTSIFLKTRAIVGLRLEPPVPVSLRHSRRLDQLSCGLGTSATAHITFKYIIRQNNQYIPKTQLGEMLSDILQANQSYSISISRLSFMIVPKTKLLAYFKLIVSVQRTIKLQKATFQSQRYDVLKAGNCIDVLLLAFYCFGLTAVVFTLGTCRT